MGENRDLALGALAAVVIANPIILAITLIFGAVLFFAGYALLVSLGVVSAMIYALFGFGFVWLIGTFSKTALEKHWWLIFIIPVFFVFGWMTDHAVMFSTLSLTGWTSESFVLTQNSWLDGLPVSMTGYLLVGLVAAVSAVMVLGTMLVKTKKKYRWVK